MIGFCIAVFIAIRCVLVAAYGFRFVSEADLNTFIDVMQRENFFINVMKIHKWTYKQFYPEFK